jgi:hypothetical protein
MRAKLVFWIEIKSHVSIKLNIHTLSDKRKKKPENMHVISQFIPMTHEIVLVPSIQHY